MKKLLFPSLAAAALLGLISTACALTVVPTFDASITGDPNGAAMTNAIMRAISLFQGVIADSNELHVKFVADESIGLGQSTTWYSAYPYSTYVTALAAHASSTNDVAAQGKLAGGTVDPVVGNSQIVMASALARNLGLATGYGPDGFDSTISLKMSLMNLTRPGTDPNKYDLTTTVEHELDEVLGFASQLPNAYPAGPLGPPDLFRYTTNLVRTCATNGDDAYFSVDGSNLIARFNQNSGGDSQDWWSATGDHWAPAGTPPAPQVQDAFGSPGTNYVDLGASELTMLDVIGYTLVSAMAVEPAAPPVLKITRVSEDQYSLTWSNANFSYALQECTNLKTGTWTASASGTNNPAIVTATGTKFYRLYRPVAPSVVVAHSLTASGSAPQLFQSVRSYQPRKP